MGLVCSYYYEFYLFWMVEHFSQPILHASLWHKITCFFFVPCRVMNLMKAALYMRGGEAGLLIRWRPAPYSPTCCCSPCWIHWCNTYDRDSSSVCLSYKLSDKKYHVLRLFPKSSWVVWLLPELHAQPIFGIRVFRTKLKGLKKKNCQKKIPFYGS